MRVTDGRTDRILIAIPRLHFMQRCKNASTVIITLSLVHNSLELPVFCMYKITPLNSMGMVVAMEMKEIHA